MSGTKNKKKTNRSAARTGGKGTGKKSAKRAPAKQPRLDENSRNDIIGVILAVLGVALFIAVLSPQSGIITRYAGDALSAVFGVGAIILPLALVIWGASFFIRNEIVSKARIGAGLGISLLAIISMVALRTPGAEIHTDLFFDPAYVREFGGYVGAGVAWAFSVTLGKTIAYVILVGVLLTGLIVTGLSISGLVQWVQDKFSRDDEKDKGYVTAKTRKQPKVAGSRNGAGAAPVTQKIPQSRLEFDEDYFEPDEGAGGKLAGKTAVLGKDPSKTQKLDTPAQKASIPKGVAPRALEGFELPDPSILKTTPAIKASRKTEQEYQRTAELLQETLATFDINARVIDWVSGPTVTMFRVEMPKGVRLNKITNLADDLQLALAANTVRIMAPIPGTSLVGVEVPNTVRSAVTLGDVLVGIKGGPLELAIGKDVEGNPVVRDLASMPHLLIGGTTGSGKSVAINSMLMSILMRSTPAEVRLILIDPKRVELSLYNGVPHLYVPVVTEPREAASALAWAVTEMERRLKLFSKAGARNIGLYNEMVQSGSLEDEHAEELPYLVVVIDELADLMMVAAKEVEDSICRIAQLARAAGIHLIVATQRPEANVVTGLIKANITNRIAFNVASSIDSRVVLDQPGAEKLIGLGDLLASAPEWGKPKRIQGAYVGENEIIAVVEHLKKQAEPEYHEEILKQTVSTNGSGGIDSGDDDPLLWEAAEAIVNANMGSTSMLQRRLKVGYARAGRIMDMLEAKGVVGPPDGSKPREVLVDAMELETLKAFESQDAKEEW